MSDSEHVIAIGLLTEQDLSVLGQGFRRVFRIEDGHDFGALLAAIDEAERASIRHCAAPPPRR